MIPLYIFLTLILSSGLFLMWLVIYLQFKKISKEKDIKKFSMSIYFFFELMNIALSILIMILLLITVILIFYFAEHFTSGSLGGWAI